MSGIVTAGSRSRRVWALGFLRAKLCGDPTPTHMLHGYTDMKIIELPDDFPMKALTDMLRESGLMIVWLGNGRYQAVKAVKPKRK